MNRYLVFLAVFVLFLGCAQQQAPAAGPAAGTAPPGTGGAPAGNQSAGGATAPQNASQAGQGTSTGTATTPTTTTLSSGEISYKAGAWKIYGTLYESKQKTPTKAIILVPQLGGTRDSYPLSFIESLHEQFSDAIVLAIDPRGHGKSTNLGNWASFDKDAFRDMRTDITSAKDNYIEPNYPNIETYYVIGASIGSTSAINAAAKETLIAKVVMISPGMEYKGVDITDSAESYKHALLMVASTGDSYSVQAISEIGSLFSGPEKESKIYTGTAHGTDLFNATKDEAEPLSGAIIEFLK